MLAALPAHPDHPRLNKLIGVAYLLSGKPAESVPYFEKCAALEEANAEARFDLSVAYEAAGELSWAAKALRAAIRIDGDYADAHNNLGPVLAKQDLLDQAVEHLSRAVALNPDSALFHGNLGAILSRQQAMDEAAGHFETAIRLDPAFAQAYGNYGDMLQRQNRLPEARDLLERAFAHCDPEDPGLLDLRAHVASHEKDFETEARCLEQALEHDAPDDQKRLQISRLGKARDRLGDYEGAFCCFADANRYSAKLAKRRGVDAKRYADYVDALIAQSERSLPIVPDDGDDDGGGADAPVFLVGFPRSGTTLLDTILGSHPDVSVLEEEPFIYEIRKSAGLIVPSSFGRRVSVPERKKLQSAYFRKVEGLLGNRDTKVLIDKSPLNTVEAGFIRSVFPDAKFIFMLRHPKDCVLSCCMQSFHLNDARANFLDIADAARLYDRSMTLWETYRDRLGIPCHTIRYEDVIADLRGTVQPLLEFLDLGWHENVEKHHLAALERGRISTPSYNQVSQPLYDHAKDRWRRYEGQLKAVDGVLNPWVEKWGYS
jgi:tetratricopeptide (TPR) repeat protein